MTLAPAALLTSEPDHHATHQQPIPAKIKQALTNLDQHLAEHGG
jgi:hypothetical protein